MKKKLDKWTSKKNIKKFYNISLQKFNENISANEEFFVLRDKFSRQINSKNFHAKISPNKVQN